MIRVGAIGYGYWGPNVVRNFQELPDCTVVSICDTDERRLALAHSRHPHVRLGRDADDVITDPQIDLVVVTTPVTTHFDLARRALEAGKHTLVAKPMATSIGDAERLAELAEKRKRLLLVDHTFVYSPAVRKIRDLVTTELGEPYYYDSTRVNLGLIQSDVSVLGDLATHDMAILDFVFATRPLYVSARAVAHFGERETVAYVFIQFEGALVAHVNVNWLAPRKVRTILVGGSQKMILYDDNEPSEKVKVYDRGVLLGQPIERAPMLVQYRSGDMAAPQLDNVEALSVECRHVLDCIAHDARPITGTAHAIRVIQLLAAAEQSIREGGREVAV